MNRRRMTKTKLSFQETVSLERGVYEHFKGNRYEVLDVALCSETETPHVVYRALYGAQKLWIRPLAMFVEQVEKEHYTGPRFRLVEASGENIFVASEKVPSGK